MTQRNWKQDYADRVMRRVERFDRAIERHEKLGNDRLALHAWRMKVKLSNRVKRRAG